MKVKELIKLLEQVDDKELTVVGKANIATYYRIVGVVDHSTDVLSHIELSLNKDI